MNQLKYITIFILLLLVGCESPINEATPVTLELYPSNDTIEVNEEFQDSGAKVIVNGTEYYIASKDIVDTTMLGLQELTYTYTYQGFEYSITRYVIVADQIPPKVELLAGIDTIKKGSIWEDAGVVITDNYEDSVSLIVTGEVNTNIVGTYPITYTAMDEAGNETVVIRYVAVVE